MNWEKENVAWLTNMSWDAYVDIVNTTVETSLQHMTTEKRKRIYFRSGKSEADDSFKVYQSIVWKKLSEMLSISLQK